MAVLDEAARTDLWAEEMRYFSTNRIRINISKNDFRAMINAIDDFLNAQAAAMNGAIPEPAQSELTKSDKARAFAAVIHRRWVEDT